MAKKRIRRQILAVRVTNDEMKIAKRCAVANGLDLPSFVRELLIRESNRIEWMKRDNMAQLENAAAERAA